MKCRYCEEEVEQSDGDWCYVSDYDRGVVHQECNDIHNTRTDLFLSRCCENCDHHSIELVNYGSWGGGDSYYEIKCEFIDKTFPFSKSKLNCDNFKYKLEDLQC